jgi:hypothetical protein
LDRDLLIYQISQAQARVCGTFVKFPNFTARFNYHYSLCNMASQNPSSANVDAPSESSMKEERISKSNIFYHKRLHPTLSNDPLLAAPATGGPFYTILPSRKYEGDYDGERVEWLESGQKVHPIEEQEAIDESRNGKVVREGRFVPRMQQEFIDRHKLGELRHDDPGSGKADASSSNSQQEKQPN